MKMWPSALQMTREECRGVLRRLELESYSNVISAFRAQGGLNDIKTKILDDLRNVFHISQDRHRAESRRVANDEQLTTISEAISGSNTYQEWCKEGTRSYPLLPRSTPQTALSIVANNVAEEVAKKNSQLPYPANTVNLIQTSNGTFIKVEDVKSDSKNDLIFKKPVVKADPNLIPLKVLPVKKNLKRNCNDTITCKGSKIRAIRKDDIRHSVLEKAISSSKYVANSKIHMLYHNHSKTQSKHKKPSSKKNTLATTKRLNKSLNKSLPMKTIKSIEDNHIVENAVTQKTSLNQPNVQKPSQNVASLESPMSQNTAETSSTVMDKTPQIATSKKDISKNLSKLNLPIHNLVQGKVHNKHINDFESKTDKFATPVKKYIVEDRKPGLLSGNASDNTKIKSVTTVMSSPPIANTKMTNLKTFKQNSDQCSTPPQVFNVVDPLPISIPLPVQHMSPTIINLNKTEQNDSPRKVLTTKILPTILAGNKSGNSVHVNSDLIKSPSNNMNHTVFSKQSPLKSNLNLSPNFSGNKNISLNNHQVINPIKLPSGVQLKNLQNRRSVKIFSSSNGEMFLQSANSKTLGKLSPVVPQNSNISLNNSPTHQANSGRIAIQKVQIIPPSLNNANNSTAMTNVGGGKTISISNPNMLLVNSSMTSGSGVGSSTGSGTVVKTIPIVKSNKITNVLPTTNTLQESVSVANSGNLSKGQNVFVIGSMASGQQSKTSTLTTIKVTNTDISENNMITEDTPIDILNTPIIVDDDESPPPIRASTKNFLSHSNISPTHIVRSNPLKKINEGRKKIEILEDITIVPKRTVVPEKQQEPLDPITNLTTSITQRKSDNCATVNDSGNVILGETDWEVELDQEANKSRELSAQKLTSRYNEIEDGFTIVEGTIHDNYNDVIEEDTIIIDDNDDINEDETNSNANDFIQYDESYESVNEDILDENIAIEYVESDDVIFEDKIDSTSTDQGYTLINDDSIMIMKHPIHNEKEESLLETNHNLHFQKKGSGMVSVEEISSTSHVGYNNDKIL